MFRSLLFLSLMASPAMAFQARNGVMVSGDAQAIVVAPSAGQAAPQSWCAAGDFVIRGLGMPAGTPVYRITPPPRRGGGSVTFSLSPDGASDRTGLIRLIGEENSVSAGHAQSLCRFGRWRY